MKKTTGKDIIITRDQAKAYLQRHYRTVAEMPTIKELAKMMGIPARTAENWIRELKDQEVGKNEIVKDQYLPGTYEDEEEKPF